MKAQILNIKLQIRRVLQLFFLLSASLCLCGENVFAQVFKQVADGIEYAEMMRGTDKEPVRLNLLKLDLTKVRLDVVHALDAAVGLEKTSSIATRHGAIAAINAGFFRMDGLYKGDAAGVLMIDRYLLSESYANRIALFIQDSQTHTNVAMGKMQTVITAQIGSQTWNISGINRERKDDELIIFNNFFHRTTLTNQDGLEIIVKKNGVISEIFDGKGSNLIPADGWILSASGKFRDELKNVKIGDEVSINFMQLLLKGTEKYDVTIVDDIVGGVPQLIKDSKIEITWEAEKIGKDFVETKHPRTAVAILEDRKFLMVTVDGRQPEHSIGINLNDLAELLLELGATDAMNLDGGGSTTMFLNGEIKNKPSDKTGERNVSDAILVFPRKKL